VDVPSGVSRLVVDLKNVPSSCDYDLYLYDSAGNEATYSTNGGNSAEQAAIEMPSAGTYYAEVISFDGSSQSSTYAISYGVVFSPVISALSPASGPRGTYVTISGSRFNAARGPSYVTFAGVKLGSADYVSWSDSSIVCRVPASAGGKPVVKVTTTGGTSNGACFYVTPLISTISPTYAKPGAIITINGIGFGTWVSGQCLVMFGSTRGVQYISWSSGTIKVRVPAVARGVVHLTVKTGGGTSAAKNFQVL
jgi:large repetitive protein